MTDLAIRTPYDAAYEAAQRHAAGWTRAEVVARLRLLVTLASPPATDTQVDVWFGCVDGLADLLRLGVRL